MAPRLPKTVESKIFDSLNESIRNGISISAFKLEALVANANSLNVPGRYATLSALYSHALEYDLAYQNAEYYMESGHNDSDCIADIISGLTNVKLFNKAVELSKKYPIILEYPRSRKDTYESALYTLDIEYCEHITLKYNIEGLNISFDYEEILHFFGNDEKLVSRASAYFNYVYSSLADIFAEYSVLGNSLVFGVSQVEDYSSLHLAININGQCFDNVLDIECKWHKKLAQYVVVDEKLCSIAFSMEISC
ncbi:MULTISPECIES: hypothetical protein [Colwellia]|uniref:Uncharacterized protein n=1 Tax=Colwellia marinimaniae TaxID=1513592 RepID=A0ABQ0MV51_9GAMM|nr:MULTISPECIES: hypothetical protein [Colwellia]GAW96238.1 hypothetical protein MTCD1_01852 [Colwellia marinimaniae]